MQKIKIENVSLYFGDRLLYKIDSLIIEEGEKIGIVGGNGVGKTSLFNLLTGQIKVDTGVIECGSYTYMKQFEDISDTFSYWSGGEKTKKILYEKIKKGKDIWLLDEPTNHLDIHEVKNLETKLKKWNGTLLLISHDRNLLDSICTSILEIENQKIMIYKGNYSSYKRQKEIEKNKQKEDYMTYLKEKKRLEKSIIGAKETSKNIRKAPRRMGNSEARLHRRESTEIKAKLDRNRKSIEARLENLAEKEKPLDTPTLYINIENERDKNHRILFVDDLKVSFLDNKVIESCSFEIKNGSKVALIGENGSGKTSIIRKIIENSKGIYIHPTTKIGYFSQELELLEMNETVFSYLRKNSMKEDKTIERITSQLCIPHFLLQTEIKKLSGGEKVKVALAKIILTENSFLILDEATNFLDIPSLEGLELMLKEYQGTVLFTSHDREFIDEIASEILIIENKRVIPFKGNYTSYLENKQKKEEKFEVRKLEIDMRLTFLIFKMENCPEDEKEELEREYKKLIQEKNK